MSGWILLTDIVQVQETILRYHKIFYYCRLLAVICGGLSIILFMVLEIPSVVGDITGASAKKMIKKYEENNAAAMRHTQKKFFETGKSLSLKMNKGSSRIGTAALQEETAVLQEETTVLQEESGENTRVLDHVAEDVNATRVLDEEK